jgi:hypothetical protein
MNIEGYTYIAHKLIQRPWGPECRFTFARPDGSHINDVIPIPSVDISTADLTALVTTYLGRMKAEEGRQALFSHVFDQAGPEVKEAVFWLIWQIRQYPNATYAQAETAWNAAWADSLFTFAKLASYVQKLAGDVTWANFKTYVINHYFEGID